MIVPYPKDHVKCKEGEEKQTCQVVFPKSHRKSGRARQKQSSRDLWFCALLTRYAASQILPSTWIQQAPECVHVNRQGEEKSGSP